MRYAGHPGQLGRQFPKVETMLREAADELLAFAAFPVPPWQKIRSTNPLERLNKEIKRRTDVVGVLPNPAALLRRTVAVLVEAHDAPPPLRHIHHAAGRDRTCADQKCL